MNFVTYATIFMAVIIIMIIGIVIGIFFKADVIPYVFLIGLICCLILVLLLPFVKLPTITITMPE